MLLLLLLLLLRYIYAICQGTIQRPSDDLTESFHCENQDIDVAVDTVDTSGADTGDDMDSVIIAIVLLHDSQGASQ